MGDVLSFPRPVPKDGGKARIPAARARRNGVVQLDRQYGASNLPADSLVMLRPDPELPCDCA